MINPAFRAALGAMASIPQWFVWRMTWDAAKGKYQKVPVYTDGSMRREGEGAPNPALWMTLDAAAAAVAALPATPEYKHTIGFYLTRNTGYWFLDVDKCFAPDGTCNAQGVYLYQNLPNAFYERSSSENGFHIIGRGAVPDHSNECLELGIEFYTDGRGIAFNPTYNALGNADTDHSAALQIIVPHYFKPKANAATGDVTHRRGPREDWRGPSDDDDLLRRAMMSHSSASLFNAAKATFADLFHRDVAKLRLAYPDPTNVNGYGESEADAALASHLAFWTGCDVERMERLMRRSPLARPKWDERRPSGTWLTHTCINAVGVQRDVLQDKPVEIAEPVREQTTDITGKRATGQRFLGADEQIELFKGCVYVREENKIYVPTDDGYEALDRARFNFKFGRYTFVMDADNAKVTREAWECFGNSQLVEFKQVATTRFRPKVTPRSLNNENGLDYLNTYVPAIVERKKGNAAPFVEHIARILPNKRDQDIFISYLAAAVQYPGVKFGWCPVIQGAEGNGKTTLARIMQHAIGKRYVHAANASTLGNNFNAWLTGKLFIIVNDVNAHGREEFMEAVKPMITDTDLQIEAKGRDQISGEVCANFLMSMNAKNGIIKKKNDRRYAIFYTAQQTDDDIKAHGLDDAYFKVLHDWLDNDGYAITSEFLATFPIVPGLNPAKDCFRAPATSTLADVLRESKGPMEMSLEEAVQLEVPGFIGGWISWSTYRRYMQELHPKASLHTLEEVLRNAGYVPHPSLGPKGITFNAVGFTGKKDRIYVKAENQELVAVAGADAVKLYESAQITGRVTYS